MKPCVQFGLRTFVRAHPWRTACLAGLVLVASATTNLFAATAIVANDLDSGPGSFRAAIAAANADVSITTIRFAPGIGTISAQSTLTYSGPQSLTIDGQGATLDGSLAASDLLVASGGANLSLRRLIVQNSQGSGIVVSIPPEATGTVEVALSEVALLANALYGLHIDDLAGSPAGTVLTVEFCSVLGNGLAESDKDGIRVDERSEGDI